MLSMIIKVDGKWFIETPNGNKSVNSCRGCAFNKEVEPEKGYYNECRLPEEHKLIENHEGNIISLCPFFYRRESIVFKKLKRGI